MIDTDILEQIYKELFELKLKKIIPENDTDKLRLLFKFVKRFYSKCSIDSVTNLCIIQYDNDIVGLEKNKAIKCTIGKISNNIKFPAIIQLLSNGCVYIWNECYIDIDTTRIPKAIIYNFNGREENIITGGECVLAPTSCFPSKSIFVMPTYLDLEEALDEYYRTFARYSVCNILQEVWLDDKRLRLKPAPESKFRDSLWQYLKGSLRTSIDILREQNVSTKNPIDIKIIWQDTNERALIEIKWLGVSFDAANGRITANHTKSKIKLGSKQLVDYIEVASEQTPSAYFKGYLVVFDARRQMIVTDDKLERHTMENSVFYRECDDTDQLVNKFVEKNCIYKRFFMEPVIEERSFSSA